MNYFQQPDSEDEYASGLKGYLPQIKTDLFERILEAADLLQGLISDEDEDVTAEDMFRLIFKEAALRGYEDFDGRDLTEYDPDGRED